MKRIWYSKVKLIDSTSLQINKELFCLHISDINKKTYGMWFKQMDSHFYQISFAWIKITIWTNRLVKKLKID